MGITDSALDSYYRNLWEDQYGYDPMDPYARPYPEGGEYEEDWYDNEE